MNVLRRIVAALLNEDGAPSLHSRLVLGAVYRRRVDKDSDKPGDSNNAR